MFNTPNLQRASPKTSIPFTLSDIILIYDFNHPPLPQLSISPQHTSLFTTRSNNHLPPQIRQSRMFVPTLELLQHLPLGNLHLIYDLFHQPLNSTLLLSRFGIISLLVDCRFRSSLPIISIQFYFQPPTVNTNLPNMPNPMLNPLMFEQRPFPWYTHSHTQPPSHLGAHSKPLGS